jgi:hypothetical protein
MGEAEVWVARRRVFYIPGYDPFPPRRYRELYRREAAAQAALTGDRIEVRRDGAEAWAVAATVEGRAVEAGIEVLVWADLVQGSMGQSIAATYAQLARTAWVYIASGALVRLMRLRKGPVLAALYPVAMLLAQLALALALGLAAVALLGRALPAPWAWAGLLLAWPVLAGFRRADRWFFAYYLMHDYAHAAGRGGAYPPELEARLAGFRARIAAALAGPADEVLVVGHSSGASLAVSVVADLLRRSEVPQGGPVLSLLTLGQVVPMVSFLPDADRLRADLNLLSRAERLAWVDITAPGDGAAFALCDPVAVSGVAPAEGKRWPLVLSAAFTRTLRPETWARLRWRFHRLHFQYLHAFDALPGDPGDYDYFRVTAGPRTLAARFAGRPPSRSRIEAPVSGHTSMAA